MSHLNDRLQRLLFLKKVEEQHREYVEDELKKCGNDPERLATMVKINDIVKINSAWIDEELGKFTTDAND